MGAAIRPPRNRAPMIVQGTSAKLRPNRKPTLAQTAITNSLVSTILRGSIRPEESNVGVAMGPQPPPPKASRNPAISPRGARKLLGTGLTWTGRSCRLKEKRASTKTPSPNRKTAKIGSAASAVMNALKTRAPRKAPMAPGIASDQTFDQSTFPNRQCEAPDAAVVPTSAMCMPKAEACREALRARNRIFGRSLENLAVDHPDVDRFPGFEVQLPGVFAGHLGPESAPVLQGQVDPDLEPEVDEVVDDGLGGRAVGVELDLDVVRTDVGIAQAVHGPDKAHDELVCRLFVKVLRPTNLFYLAVVHQDYVVRQLHRLFLVVSDQDGRHVDVFVQPAKPSPQLLADPGVEGAERLIQQQDVRLDSEGARQGHPLALAP